MKEQQMYYKSFRGDNSLYLNGERERRGRGCVYNARKLPNAQMTSPRPNQTNTCRSMASCTLEWKETYSSVFKHEFFKYLLLIWIYS